MGSAEIKYQKIFKVCVGNVLHGYAEVWAREVATTRLENRSIDDGRIVNHVVTGEHPLHGVNFFNFHCLVRRQTGGFLFLIN
jgi:hypothetical protein